MYDQEIPNLKNQITNNFPKSMNPNSKCFCKFFAWNLKSGFWNFFVFLELAFWNFFSKFASHN